MYKIIEYPDPGLHGKSDEVIRFNGEIAKIVVGMKRLLLEKEGHGLSAPQIGEKKRIIVIALGNSQPILAMINPRVVTASGEKTAKEGCLSTPGVSLPITRPERAVIKAQDIKGDEFSFNANEASARAVLHEIDHLDGILLWDHLQEDERKSAVNSYLENRLGDSQHD